MGWVISVGPKGSGEDCTFPVTFPIRTGEQQVLGTGWGDTVQDKLAYPRMVEFVLTHADFVQYSGLADETLTSPRPEVAGQFIAKVATLPKGRVTVVALQYGKGPTAETVKWMTYKASIVVPESFRSVEVPWRLTPCSISGK